MAESLPFILAEPMNLTVISPENATFTCVATGIPYPDISWWFMLPSSDNFSSVSSTFAHDILLAPFIQSTLNLPSAGFENKSPLLIACIANNSVGTVNASATLIIQGLPSILTEPINLTVISPANANFTCVAMGIPYPDISWWLFGPSSDNFSSVSNTSTHDNLLDAVTRQSILTLPSADFQNKSPVMIACVANNSVGVVIASAILIIKVAPSISFTSPSSGSTVTLNQGSSTAFFCNATGDPIPTILFVLPDNSTSSGTVSGTYTDDQILHRFSILDLSNLTGSDHGRYTCVAENGVAENASAFFELQIQDNWAGTDCSQFVQTDKGAEIVTHPSDTVVNLFESVELRCIADGVPRPSIKWFKNGVEIVDEVFDVLRISEIDLNDRGFYSCLVENKIRVSETIVEQKQETSITALLNIQNIAQYKASVEIEVTIRSRRQTSTPDEIIESVNHLAVGTELNQNEIIFSVSAQEGINANSTRIPILVTVISNKGGSDALLELLRMTLTDIATQLTDENNYALTISGIERFDGCISEDTINRFEADSTLDIILEWSESNIGEEPVILCPCSNLSLVNGQLNTASRRCGGDFIAGASWEEPKDSACNFTEVARKLCRISEIDDTAEAVVQLEDITEETDTIQALEVSITTSLLELFTEEVTESDDRNLTENFLNIIDNVIAVDTEILQQSQETSNSSARILATVQSVADNIPIPENESTVVISLRSFAIAVQEFLPNEFVQQTFGAIINLEGEQDNADYSLIFGENAAATASISLPESVFMSLPPNTSARITNAVYLNDALFLRREKNSREVGGIIISAGLVGNMTIEGLSPPIQLTFVRNPDLQHGMKPLCTFWDPSADDRNGDWSTRGCTVINQTNMSVDCECDHLTNFAILLDVSPITEPTPPPTVPERVLGAFSFAGIILSIGCLILTIATYLSARKLRRTEVSQLLLLLCSAFLGIYFSYIFAYFATPVPGLCAVAGALVHYTLLVTFFTMAAEAILVFLKIVMVFTTVDRYVAKAGIVVWSVPLFIVGFCLAPNYRNYTNINFCRPYGIPFYIGLLTPFIIIYIFNWVIFVIVLARILKKQRDTKLRQGKMNTTEQIRQQLVSAIVLSILFGLGWGFALPATQGINNTAVQILFQAIYIALTAFQGVFIFIMHCLVGRNSILARQEWKRWIRRVSSRRSSVYSSGDYSNSTLERVRKRFRRSGKDGTLGTNVTSDSSLQRGSNLYGTLPRKTPLSSVESESMFNSSVIESATLERTVKDNQEDKAIVAVADSIDVNDSTTLLSEDSLPMLSPKSTKMRHVSFSDDNPPKTRDELSTSSQQLDCKAIRKRMSAHSIEEAGEKEEEEEEGTLEEDVFVNPVAIILDHNETASSGIISPSLLPENEIKIIWREKASDLVSGGKIVEERGESTALPEDEATEAFEVIWNEFGQRVLPQRSEEKETGADRYEGAYFENPFTAMEEGLQESDLVSDGKTVMEGNNSTALMMPEGEATAIVITNPLVLAEEGKVPHISMATDDKDTKCSMSESVGDITRMANTSSVWTGSEMTLKISDVDMGLEVTPTAATDSEEYTAL